MRNPTDVLNSLNKQSKNPSYKFQRLYRNLYNPEFYLLAYRNIYANEGSMTPGVDGETLDGMSSPRIERIINALKDHSYRPNPARRTYIAKKNSSKKRPLGIPSGDDKLVQEVVRMILESIYEPTFFDQSHGFRPKRSCHTALEQLQRTFAGANWFVEGDIQACFDSFDHQVLINILRRRIDDEAFISLMWKFFKAGYMEQWRYHRTYCGTPQGSGISPILANIYLHELDMHMEEYKTAFVKGNRLSRKVKPEYARRNREVQAYKRRNAKIWNTLTEAEKKERAGELRRLRERQREIPSKQFRDETYKNLQYVRYADDFIVGVVGSKADAEALKADLAVFLKETLNLTLSEKKTKITHATDRARFLGYDISISKSREITKRQGKKVKGYSGAVKLYMPHEKWESKLMEYGAIRIKKDKITQIEHWKAIHRPKLINRRDIEILSKYNSEIRGLYNYYSLACNVCAMSKFASLMHYSMLKTFANKYRTTANKIKLKYFKNGRFTVVYQTKSGAKESAFYRGPFTRKDKPNVPQADVLPAYKKYDRPNRLAAKLRSKTCELCGQYTNDMQIHQVKRLKSLSGEYEWERIMLKNHRKTLAVCPACHREIHEKD